MRVHIVYDALSQADTSVEYDTHAETVSMTFELASFMFFIKPAAPPLSALKKPPPPAAGAWAPALCDCGGAARTLSGSRTLLSSVTLPLLAAAGMAAVKHTNQLENKTIRKDNDNSE